MDSSFRNVSVLTATADLTTRTLMRDVLRTLGVGAVFQVNDLAEAAQTMKMERGLNIMFCDWRLRDGEGLDLVRRARAEHPNLLFVIMSGDADRKYVQAAAQAGVGGFLLKPFSRAQIDAKLRVALAHMQRPRTAGQTAPASSLRPSPFAGAAVA